MSEVLGVKGRGRGHVWLASSSSSPALPRQRRKQRALLACRLMVMVLVLCAFCLFSTMYICVVEKKEYDKGVPMKQGTNQVESWKEPDSCNKSGNDVSTLFSSLSSGDIHKMRRMIALSGNSSCYSRFLPSFVNYTLHRIKHVHNHLNLHIPKSGGTSICSLATEKAERDTNFTVATTNGCWEREHFLPLWCSNSTRFVPGGDRSEWLDYNNEADPSTSTSALCNAMDRKLPMFVMNENYLDHPLCTQQRIYSIVLRNPVDRVMSNERHLLEFGIEHNKERLQLIWNNYIVWALSSGTTKHGERLSILPQKEHLEIAKETLLQFDYLLDITLTFPSSCHDDILYLMGLASGDGKNPPHEMKGKGKQNNLALTRKEYKELNLLDIELYEYAQSVMRVDCEFFSLVRQQMKKEEALVDLLWRRIYRNNIVLAIKKLLP